MTRVDVEHRLSLYFENDTYYTPYDLQNSIQDGYDEVISFSGAILKSATIPFTQNLSYYDMLTLLPDYIGVYAIFNNVTNRWMWPTSERKLDQVRPDWETSIGTPEYFVPKSHRYMAIFRKPSTALYGNMYVFYRASAPTLGDSDVIQLPDDYVNALSDYCIADLLEQQQEFTKASLRLSSYMDNLEQLRVWIQNQRIPDMPNNLRP